MKCIHGVRMKDPCGACLAGLPADKAVGCVHRHSGRHAPVEPMVSISLKSAWAVRKACVVSSAESHAAYQELTAAIAAVPSTSVEGEG